MKSPKKIRSFKKDSDDLKRLDEIVKKFPENTEVTKEILEILDNDTTKLKLDEDIKNSYYVYINDTIYLSNKESNKKAYHRICLIAHECIHTIQSKKLQRLNFIISNIEMILFFIIGILMFIFKENSSIFLYSYLGVVIVSMIPRFILELDAIRRSVDLSKTYVKKVLDKEETQELIGAYKEQISRLIPFALLTLFIDKYIRCIILVIINTII